MFGNVNPKLYFINNFLNKVDLMDIIEYGQLDKKSQLIYKDVLEILSMLQALCTLTTKNNPIYRDYLDEKLGRLYLACKDLNQLYNFVEDEDEEKENNKKENE